jgi:B12-binding domain/radical SAM domain protein
MKNSLKTDLILLHAPSVYDFRKKSIMFGPVSDLVPSSPIFEMYPIGFLTMANYLAKRGLNVRIINLAYRMFHDADFDVEKFIRRLKTKAFGIDLHWLPHCQGSQEIAKIVKKYHPEKPVIFGGFSSSYFYKELIEFETVDYIIRGDSAEEPLYNLVSLIKEAGSRAAGLWEDGKVRSIDLTAAGNKAMAVGESMGAAITGENIPIRDSSSSTALQGSQTGPDSADTGISLFNAANEERLKSIPNLVWKTGGQEGQIHSNEIKCISGDLQEIDFDYRIMFKEVLKYRDIRSIVPFCDWFRYPITTIPVVRGCSNNCSNCGGSKHAFEIFGRRSAPAFRDPGKLVREIRTIRKYINSPIFLLGDLNSNGKEYVMEFFKFAKDLDKGLQIFFEFFTPPKEWFFDEASKVFSKVCYEISPDSHDEEIRKIMGKSFSNEEMIKSIEYALLSGAARFDLYFMTGLPHQTKKSILETVDFSREVYERLGWDKRFAPFISPMAPFLDPGSRAFENPGKFGYKLLFRTLKEHIEAITMPSWKYILNYESDYITNDDLVYATYDAALGLNLLKAKSGSISENVMQDNKARTERAIQIMKRIDGIMEIDDKKLREVKLGELGKETYKYSLSTVCEKKELEFPLSNKSFNWFEIIKTSITDK